MMGKSSAVRDQIDAASPPFDDAITTAVINRHHRVVTRALVELADRPGVKVPLGREGNFAVRDYNRRGQLSPIDDRFTALCVAHSYGVMHYSEMLSFLRSLPMSASPLAILDLGCGIGSALLAVRAAAEEGDHRAAGFDPNPPTLELAGEVLSGLVIPHPTLTPTLDGRTVDVVTRWAAEGRHPMVTASHVFGQESLTDELIEDMARRIAHVVRSAGHAQFVGMEPDRSGVVERGHTFLAALARWVEVECLVDDVRDLVRLETRSTSAIAPLLGPCRKRVRWYSLRSPAGRGTAWARQSVTP